MTKARAIEVLNIGYDGCVKFRETLRGNSDDDVDYLNDLLIALLTAIDALEQNNEWVSVKDRMPEEGVDVLVYLNRKSADVDFVDRESGNFFYYDEGEVTHWRPLPEPPESEDAE